MKNLIRSQYIIQIRNSIRNEETPLIDFQARKNVKYFISNSLEYHNTVNVKEKSGFYILHLTVKRLGGGGGVKMCVFKMVIIVLILHFCSRMFILTEGQTILFTKISYGRLRNTAY